jgi:hypothetical protein
MVCDGVITVFEEHRVYWIDDTAVRNNELGRTLKKAGNIVQSSTEARWRKDCCSRKAISTTYSEYVSVALVIQHAKRMRRVILSSVACLALHNFVLVLINGTIFGKTILNIKCAFWFSLQCSSEIFFILRRILRNMIINIHCFSCKAQVILVRF